MRILGSLIFILGLADLGLSFNGINITAFLGDLSQYSAWAFMAIGGLLFKMGGSDTEETEE